MSARRDELLEKAYAHALERGTTDLSLRPLSAAIGSSPRVLLYLFGSRDGLVRALLECARADELGLLGTVEAGDGLQATAAATWTWLADPRHRPLLTLWVEAYGRSLTDPDGPWGGFAHETVRDWLRLLEAAEPHADPARRRAALALLRGALLDLLATGERKRTTAAVTAGLAALG